MRRVINGIEKKGMPVVSRMIPGEDAQHMAYTTTHEMDVLVSWNFKHLANVNREEKIRQVNVEAGYRYPLRLLSPLEVAYEA